MRTPQKTVVNPSVTHTIKSGKSLVVIEERKQFYTKGNRSIVI